MTNNQQIISKLSELWGSCLVNHHKNCDTQHFLNQVYTFGGLEFSVEHYGYLSENYTQSFNTLEAAENYLIKKLKEQIKSECDHQIYALDYPNEYDTNKDKGYWNNILKEIEDLKIEENPPENFEEKYLNLLKMYNSLSYDTGLIEKILDKHNIPNSEHEIPFSLNYRVELLIKKLEKGKI